MKKHMSKINRTVTVSKLTSSRAEKISAVEGMVLTTRMKALLLATQDKPGEERRAMIKAQFSKKYA